MYSGVRYTSQQQEQVLQTLTDSMSDVITNMSSLKHVESGVISCGRSSQWTGQAPGDDVYIDRTVAFTQMYQHPPEVHLSLALINDDQDNDTYFQFYLINVNTQRFTARCQKWVKYAHIRDLRISWISIPK